MEARIIRRGHDLAVELPADEAEQLGISEGQTLTVVLKARHSETERGAMPPRRFVDGEPILTLAEMVAEMERLGPSHRPELVDWGPDVGAEIIRDD
ncbi:antitoxin MazE [Methylobacterium sp. BE186]|uniref:AbrB/MazE/SpoVT family DNA-binding domain-containing protein n=1 Tax=Methylobacterium sp. BE186 TaxID=2817715 RepID=UPI00285E88E7|nr:MazF family transcriptional regulator [Methylobacterium sp. BE186]MDR7037561.1 antitoxin MazE [Methylobacterium sp. BE186]